MAAHKDDRAAVGAHGVADAANPAGPGEPDFRALLHAMPRPWLVLLPDPPRFTIAAANDEYLRAAMRPAEDLVGRGLFDAMPDANPDNPEPTGQRNIRVSLETVMRTGEPHRMDVQRYDAERPDGTWKPYYWVPVHTPVPGPGGGVRYILETLEDVTDRVLAERAARVAEQQLRTAFLQAPALVALTEGPEHRFVLANPRFEEVLGRGPLVGRTVGEALSRESGPAIVAILDRVHATAEAFVANEQRVPTGADGGEPYQGWFNFVYQPLLGSEGQVTGVLQHAVEVTDQVRARREIEDARNEAERANRAKSEFLAVMSHELRTPLNAISGYTELLEIGIHGPVTDAQRRSLDRIQVSQQHLLGLINDVLNYAKLETGSVRYEAVPVPVPELFASVETLVAPQVRAAGLELRVGLDGAAGVVVRGDPEKLRQILLNLLGNAIKFTDPTAGAGCVELGCRAGPEQVELWVRDTGIGIADDKLDSIFEPFVQVRGDLTRTAEGTGLGLAISRDLAQGMGGELRVQSVSGEGSTFTLTVPRV